MLLQARNESEQRKLEASNRETLGKANATISVKPGMLEQNEKNEDGWKEDIADSSKDLTDIVPMATFSAQKSFILDLLQSKYHYTQGGLVRPAAESPEGRQLQQAMMLLSATLYSSQVHFVMELIQNADDNSYLPGVTPTIRLELFPHAVIVYNNEQGFSDKNIEAVCNVGGSTKANKTGYIGQKGIG